MSEEIAVDPAASAGAADAAAVGDEKTGPSGSSGLTPSSQVKSMEDFKKMAPDVYEKMMLGIATNICNKMKDHQERLKKLWRESTANSRG